MKNKLLTSSVSKNRILAWIAGASFACVTMMSAAHAGDGSGINFDKLWGTSSSTPAQQKMPPKHNAKAALTEGIVKSVIKRTYDAAFAEYYRQHPDEQQPDDFVYELTPFQIRKFAFTEPESRKTVLMYAVDTTITVRMRVGGSLSAPTKLDPDDGNVIFFYQDAAGAWNFSQEARSEIGKYVSLDSMEARASAPSSTPSSPQSSPSSRAGASSPNGAAADRGTLYLLQQTSVGPYGFSVSYCWYAFGSGDLAYRCAVESDSNGFFAAAALDTFDVAGACQVSPKSCGKLSGGRIAWTDGSETKIEQKSDGFHISGLKVLSLRPFARGQRFDGRFEKMGGVHSSAVYESGSTNMYFNMDGTFHDASGKGTYELIGATLVLNYQGRQVKLPVMDIGINREKTPQGKPEALFLGDRYYKRYDK